MSQENVEIVRKVIATWNTEGLVAMLRLLSEDVVWYPVPEWPDGAEARHGHDGVRELMGAWTDNFDEWSPDSSSRSRPRPRRSDDVFDSLGMPCGTAKDG